MSLGAAAREARRHVVHEFHAVLAAVDVDDPGFGVRVVACREELLVDGLDVPVRRARTFGGQAGGIDLPLARLQEFLDADVRKRLRPHEVALIVRLLNAHEINPLAVLRDTVVLCVQDLVVKVVSAEILKALLDVLVVLAALDRGEPHHIFKDEDLGLLAVDVLADAPEDRAPAPLVCEALLLARRAEGLAGEARDIQVGLGGRGVVALREVVVPLLGREVRHDRLLSVHVHIAREDMVHVHAQVLQRHHRGLHATAIGAQGDRLRSHGEQRTRSATTTGSGA
mmetsp:Transcript_79048/g.256355  ORF Transcript_79048/g.256355 Transcript_79048/m.256355 type:complete len:283 (-) Transcript_79048:11-859(-)